MIHSEQEVQIIGIDCATQPEHTGISQGIFCKGEVTIQEATRCSQNARPDDEVVQWIKASKCRKKLIAIDAPLGWPVPLTTGLVRHAAGTFIQGKADDIFYRSTDQVVLKNYGFRPLAVGADLIARTAHAALALLDSIRRKMEAEIPLVWDNNNLPSISLIEVYPAATLKSHKITAVSYKKQTKTNTRREISRELSKYVQMEDLTRKRSESSSDVLDSVVCLLAGADFLRGVCIEPQNHALAEKEGWIWVKKPDSGT